MKLIRKILHFSRRFTEQDELPKVLNDLGLKNNPMIFDVGAHKGQTSSHFFKLFPQSFIHAFEPSPILFAEIEKNLSKRKNIRCHNFALGQTDEKAFLTRPNSDLCGQVVKTEENNSTSICVHRLDKFCLDENISAIDLLKIDVEGNELSFSRELPECSKEMPLGQSYLSATSIKKTNNIPISLIFLTS